MIRGWVGPTNKVMYHWVVVVVSRWVDIQMLSLLLLVLMFSVLLCLYLISARMGGSFIPVHSHWANGGSLKR